MYMRIKHITHTTPVGIVGRKIHSISCIGSIGFLHKNIFAHTLRCSVACRDTNLSIIHKLLFGHKISQKILSDLYFIWVPIVKNLKTSDKWCIISFPVQTRKIDSPCRSRIHIEHHSSVRHINGKLIIFKQCTAVNNLHILTACWKISSLVGIYEPLQSSNPLLCIEVKSAIPIKKRAALAAQQSHNMGITLVVLGIHQHGIGHLRQIFRQCR